MCHIRWYALEWARVEHEEALRNDWYEAAPEIGPWCKVALDHHSNKMIIV